MGQHIELFPGFYYGMKKEEVLKKLEAGPCAEDLQNSLLLCANKPVDFLDEKWREQLTFNNLNELQQTSLFMEAREDLIPRLLATIRNEKWIPLLIETDDAVFDFLEILRKQGEMAALNNENEFINKAIASGQNCTIHFISEKYALKFLKNPKINLYSTALDHAPDNIIELCLMSTPDNIGLTFTAPLMSRKNALRYGTVIKR